MVDRDDAAAAAAAVEDTGTGDGKLCPVPPAERERSRVSAWGGSGGAEEEPSAGDLTERLIAECGRKALGAAELE